MSPLPVNLIPRGRLVAARSRRHRRWWLGAVALYAALLVPLVLAVRTGWSGGDAFIQADWQRTAAAVEKSGAEVDLLRAELHAISAQVNASEIVSAQPDWSILLAVLASTLGEEVFLSGCELTPLPGGGLKLELSGLARSQQAAAQFVLRLEHHPLFDEIKFLDTRRETFRGEHAVVFRIECMLIQPLSPGGASR